jgi:hypothetical protein
MARRSATSGLLALLVILVLPTTALATHARPKSAIATTFRLVPAYKACQSPFSGSHNAPISGSSCVPQPDNNYLTFNAPDRPSPFNSPVDGEGFVEFRAACGTAIGINFTSNGDLPPCNANAGDQEDMSIQMKVVGVRCSQNNAQGLCNPSNPGCSPPNCLTAGQLYQYRLRVVATLRLTDHDNTRSADPSCGSSCAGTLTDLSYFNDVQCTNGTCNLTTSLEAQYPGGIKEGKRHAIEITSFAVDDSFEFRPFLRMGTFMP